MLLPRFVVWIFWCGMTVMSAGVAFSQTYPNKPIRIVTSQPGGGTALLARMIAEGISGPLAQPVIVENRGGGFVIGEIVARATPDGYTLVVVASSFWIAPILQKMPYDPIKDFSPITLVARQINILTVHPSLPVNSVKELIALAKARPGALNYASSGLGGSNHLAAEFFNSMAGVNIVRINYRGAGPAVIGLLGGEAQLMFATSSSVMSHVNSGRLRALAVTSAQPSVLLPGLPTVAASGVPGYEAVQNYGMFAPAKTPATTINRLIQEVVRFLNQTDVKERLLNVGIESVGSSPKELVAAIKSEMTSIKDAGIKAD